MRMYTVGPRPTQSIHEGISSMKQKGTPNFEGANGRSITQRPGSKLKDCHFHSGKKIFRGAGLTTQMTEPRHKKRENN